MNLLRNRKILGFGGDKSGNRCQSQTVGSLNDKLSNSDFYKMSASVIEDFQGEWLNKCEFGKDQSSC